MRRILVMRVKPASLWVILVLSCFITASLLISSAGASQESGEFIFIVTDGEATITGYTGEGWEVVIPAEIEGVPVTGIGSKAFYKKEIYRVAIPESVISIGEMAFAENPIMEIYGAAGSAAEAFASDNRINFIVPALHFTVVDGKAVVTSYRGLGEDVIIPAEWDGYPVTEIADNVFCLTDLFINSVTIPNTVTVIGDAAFVGNRLTTIIIPESVISIGSDAFVHNRLDSIVIMNSAAAIGENAFEAQDAWAEVTTIFGYSGSTAETYANKHGFQFLLLEHYRFVDGDYTYYIADRKATITRYTGGGGPIAIPAELGGFPVTGIGKAAYSAKGITSVVIPDGVTTIGNGAFEANPINSLTIPDSVTSIGELAFNSNQLTEVFIPCSVTSIGPWAFENIQRDPAELTIRGFTGSAAEAYANEHGHIFEDAGSKEVRSSPKVMYLLLGLSLLAVVGAAVVIWMKRKQGVGA